MRGIGRKQYELTVTKQRESSGRNLEACLTNAVLLSLLEHEYISLWQYERCSMKLHLPETELKKRGKG